MRKKLTFYLYLTWVICLIWVVCSCSAGWHLQRAIDKNPDIIQGDTLVQVDTVYQVVNQVDTVFKVSIDTVVYHQDSVLVKYFYNFRDSTAYIEVDCPDCPEVTKTVTLPQVVKYPSTWQYIKKFAWTYLILLALVAAAWFASRMR